MSLGNARPVIGRDPAQLHSVAIADWAEPVKTCLRRICRWRVPANWSVPAWFDEMRSVATFAALEAERVFDPKRGTPFQAFVQSRVLARALTFYRQEWAYAVRHVDGVSLPADQERFLPDQSLFASEIGETLREILASLPEQDGWLLEQLYGHERAEAELARQLGVSQRTVNKRKHAALSRLREHVERQARRIAEPPNEKACGKSPRSANRAWAP